MYEEKITYRRIGISATKDSSYFCQKIHTLLIEHRDKTIREIGEIYPRNKKTFTPRIDVKSLQSLPKAEIQFIEPMYTLPPQKPPRADRVNGAVC
jgi:hypothetical protein